MSIHLVNADTGHHFTVTDDEILLAGIGGVISLRRTDLDRVLGAYVDAKDSDAAVGDVLLGSVTADRVRVIIRGPQTTIVISRRNSLVSATFNAAAVETQFNMLLDDEAN